MQPYQENPPSWNVTVPPATEPVLLEDAKLHLRVDIYDDDTLIAALLTAARNAVEETTGRQLVTATWKWSADRFPWSGYLRDPVLRFGLYQSRQPRRYDHAIVLPRPPLQSVTSIVYVDMDGTTQTLDPSTYLVDTQAVMGRIVPAYGQSWPTARYQPNSVSVTYVAGYGAASAVPEDIKAWIKLRLSWLYENRGGGPSAEWPEHIDGLIWPYRVSI